MLFNVIPFNLQIYLNNIYFIFICSEERKMRGKTWKIDGREKSGARQAASIIHSVRFTDRKCRLHPVRIKWNRKEKNMIFIMRKRRKSSAGSFSRRRKHVERSCKLSSHRYDRIHEIFDYGIKIYTRIRTNYSLRITSWCDEFLLVKITFAYSSRGTNGKFILYTTVLHNTWRVQMIQISKNYWLSSLRSISEILQVRLLELLGQCSIN